MKIIFTLILFSTLIFSQGWYKINAPNTDSYKKIHVFDSLNIIVTSSEGNLIRSTNGGISWDIMNISNGEEIIDISFFKEFGYIVTKDHNSYPYSKLFRSIDRGVTWTKSSYSFNDIILSSVFTMDSLKCFVGGNKGCIAISEDGGNSWKFVLNSIEWQIHDIKLFNDTLGFACGGQFDQGGQIWRTTDGGYTWQEPDTAISGEPFFSIFQVSSSKFLATGGDYEFGVTIAKTINNGDVWNCSTISLPRIGRDIEKRTNNEFWISIETEKDTGIIILDSVGLNFIPIHVPDSSIIFDIAFADSLHGYAVGNFGTILKYDKRLVDVKDEEIITPDIFKLGQNFPNPFNPATTFEVEIPLNRTGSFKTKIEVINSLGELVEVVYNGELSSGRHKFRFNGENLTSGVYYYRVISENETITKKMILLR